MRQTQIKVGNEYVYEGRTYTVTHVDTEKEKALLAFGSKEKVVWVPFSKLDYLAWRNAHYPND